MAVKTYKAMDLLNSDKESMWALPEGPMNIEFSKKDVLKTTKRRTVFSWYLWEVVRQFPALQLTSAHHIGSRMFVKGIEMDLLSTILWDTFDAYVAIHGDDSVIWPMSKVIYETTNNLHNVTLTELGSYATTVDLSDINDIITHPKIAKVKQQAADEEMGIEEAHRIIVDIIRSDPRFRHNGLAAMTRAGLLAENQLVQFIGPRGHVRKTNGDNFKLPIDVGYVDGLSTLYDSATESRSASTSHYMNDRPLQDSEYFNRMMQLFTGIVKEVRVHDCGTKHTIDWLVQEGDVAGLVGKYHMVNGKPVVIKADDQHLVGTNIKLRTITKCESENTSTPCAICLGDVSKVIPPKTNIGHVLTIEPLSAVSQLILSTKHVIASKAAINVDLSGNAGKWLAYAKEDTAHVNLIKKSPTGNYVLKVLQREVSGLNSIQSVDKPENLSIEYVSCVKEIALYLADENGNPVGDGQVINTTVAGKGSALSIDVIKAIKEHGVHYSDDFIDIKLMGFTGKRLLSAPRGNEDMVSYLKTIKGFIFGSDKGDRKAGSILEHEDCASAIRALKTIFDKKIRVSFVHVEIFIRSAMTRDWKNNDYTLPRGNEPYSLCPAKRVIANRCVSASLAFQGQEVMLVSPRTYLQNGKRPSFHMDPLF